MINTFYWCPFISEVATVRSTINSIRSFKKYSNKSVNPSIINVAGEWNPKVKILEEYDVNIIDLKNKNLIERLPKLGFFKSRLTYLIIFFFSVAKLHKLLKKDKPDYLIIHLISSIPLILLFFFNYKTKFVLRISGYPKLNFLRTFFWRSLKNKIFLITCPTKLTIDLLNKKKIFNQEKIYYLPDPILEINKIEIQKKQKENLEEKLSLKNSILSIGRLTEQKNFNFLINVFNKINKIYPHLNLFIIGDGEQKKFLKKKIIDLKLENKVFLTGYKKNVFNYLVNSKLFILTSNYEDPGFVFIEAGFLNKTVISSDCPNGPVEIIGKNNGYLFKKNSIDDFIKVFNNYYTDTEENIFTKKLNLKKKCKEFTMFHHYLKFKNILYK